MAKDQLAPSAFPTSNGDVIRQYRNLVRLAKQNGTIRRTFQIQRREFPNMRRRYNFEDKTYFKTWSYLKYCTQVVHVLDGTWVALERSRGRCWRGATDRRWSAANLS